MSSSSSKTAKTTATSAEDLQFFSVTKTPEMWKSISSAIMTVVDEAHFEVSDEGIKFRSMDPSHIALIDINWPSTAFEKFHCPSPIKFGVRIDEFSKIIKRAAADDSIEISILQDSRLNIKTTGGYVRNYKVNLIETGANPSSTPLPQMTFDSKIVLGPELFEKILNDIAVVSEQITIESIITNPQSPKEEEGNKTALFNGNSDKGEVKVTIDNKKKNDKDSSEKNVQEIDVKENSKSSYMLDYISKIVRSIGSQSNLVTIEHSSKKPLRLEFMLPDAVKLQFYLAPRIQD
jgi:proliferating cell nuclear antigen